MSEVLPDQETVLPLESVQSAQPGSLVGYRVRVSTKDLYEKVESIDDAVMRGAYLELEIDQQWSEVLSILASRWAKNISAYMVIHKGHRHVLQKVRTWPEWLIAQVTLYFLCPKRGGLSADERILELLDLAQAFPQHQLEALADRNLLFDNVEVRTEGGPLVRWAGRPQGMVSQSVFSDAMVHLTDFERTVLMRLSTWWLRPLTYLMLLSILILYSLSSLLDRIFVGGLDMAQEAYVRARRSENSRVKSGALAALAAAHELKRHPIVGQADRWYWLLFHLAIKLRGRSRTLSRLIYWSGYHFTVEARGRSRHFFVTLYWSMYRVKDRIIESARRSRLKAILFKPYYFAKFQWEKRVLGVQIVSKAKS